MAVIANYQVPIVVEGDVAATGLRDPVGTRLRMERVLELPAPCLGCCLARSR